MPIAKALELTSTRVTLEMNNVYVDLFAGLKKHLPNFTQVKELDIEEIDYRAEKDGAFYIGRWAKRPRLIAGLMAHPDRKSAEIMLVATHGPLAASPDLMHTKTRKSGRGNPALVARLFHVSLFYLRAAGFLALENEPINDRVRAHYTQMGFDNGEKLSLNDATCLTRSFQYIEQVYLTVNKGLTEAPLPL